MDATQESGNIGTMSLGELFEKGSHLYATRTSEAFDATDIKTGARIILWTLRFPLALESSSPIDFVRRLEQIKSLGGPFPNILAHGVDTRGVAYAATDFIRGHSVLEQAASAKVVERTFVEMLQVVSPLHQSGIVLGDISWDSFTLDEKGRVILWALLGPFESGARQTAMLPPGETLQFLAPEQRSMSGATSAADVYALGVYGYRLFTGRILHGDKTTTAPGEDLTAITPAPSTIRTDLPHWVDDVLGRCLEPDPANRFRDAGEVLQTMFDSIQSGMPPGGGGRWSKRTLIVSPQQRDQAIRPKALGKQGESEKSKAKRKQKITANVTKLVNVFIWILAVVVGVAGAGGLFFYFNKLEGTASKDDECSILTHAEYAPPELKPLIFDVTTKGATVERRSEALAKIAQSRDPIAYAVLLALTKCNAEAELKKSAEKLLVQRIGEQGTQRAASVLGKWFEHLETEKKNPAELPVYALFLRACDVARPLDSRQQALKEAYALDSEVATQLAAALTLDEREDHFLPMLRLFLAEQSPGTNFESRGAGALIISNGKLNAYFADEISSLIPKFSDSDLMWILEQLARSESGMAVVVAKELEDRKVVPPFQAQYLVALASSARPKEFDALGRSLVRGALGKVQREDIVEYARWMSLEAEPVLLATCATVSNPDLSVEAFDVLAGKTVSREPAGTLFKWVKGQYWEYRRKLAKPVCILGLIDIASDQDVEYAMGELMPFAGGGGLFRMIVQTNEDRLIKSALERLGEITAADDLIELLGHRSKAVRIEAVKALKGRNELSVLQGILQAYSREKDEDVRKVYNEIHWVTKDRDPNKMFPG